MNKLPFYPTIERPKAFDKPKIPKITPLKELIELYFRSEIIFYVNGEKKIIKKNFEGNVRDSVKMKAVRNKNKPKNKIYVLVRRKLFHKWYIKSKFKKALDKLTAQNKDMSLVEKTKYLNKNKIKKMRGRKEWRHYQLKGYLDMIEKCKQLDNG